jgi:hypothetical protein
VIPSDSRIRAQVGPDAATSFGVNDLEDCIAGAYRRTEVRARRMAPVNLDVSIVARGSQLSCKLFPVVVFTMFVA